MTISNYLYKQKIYTIGQFSIYDTKVFCNVNRKHYTNPTTLLHVANIAVLKFMLYVCIDHAIFIGILLLVQYSTNRT